MRQLCGIECSALETSTAWKMMMRQIKKPPDTFSRRQAEVAANFSMHAFNCLTPSAQLEHSWTCKVCPQDARARELFGNAVLHGNSRGACLTAPRARTCIAHQCSGAFGKRCGASQRRALRGELTDCKSAVCVYFELVVTKIHRPPSRSAAKSEPNPCCC